MQNRSHIADLIGPFERGDFVLMPRTDLAGSGADPNCSPLRLARHQPQAHDGWRIYDLLLLRVEKNREVSKTKKWELVTMSGCCVCVCVCVFYYENYELLK